MICIGQHEKKGHARAFIVAAFFFAHLTALVGCTAIKWQPAKISEEKAILDVVATQERNHRQMHAVMSLATGIFSRETVDLIVQKPNRFFLGIRSFLGPPLQALAFDGDYISYLDVSKEHEVYYEQTTFVPDEVNSILGLPIFPSQIVEIFLAEPFLEGATHVKVFREPQKIKDAPSSLLVKAIMQDGWHKEYEMEPLKILNDPQKESKEEALSSCNVYYILKKSRLKNEKLGLGYEVTYSENKSVQGIPFPYKYDVRVMKGNEQRDFHFRIEELFFGRALEPKVTFFIENPKSE